VDVSSSQENLLDVELENLQFQGGSLIGNTGVRTSSTLVFRRGDILFGRLRPYLKKWWLSDVSGIRSGEIWAIRAPSLNSYFSYCYVQSPVFLFFAMQTSGTKMPRASWENISKAQGYFPLDGKEQQKIGEFLKILDLLIAAHEEKLNLLKKQKQAYLQKMFV
jgi:type I restriction enzyme S subunit